MDLPKKLSTHFLRVHARHMLSSFVLLTILTSLVLFLSVYFSFWLHTTTKWCTCVRLGPWLYFAEWHPFHINSLIRRNFTSLLLNLRLSVFHKPYRKHTRTHFVFARNIHTYHVLGTRVVNVCTLSGICSLLINITFSLLALTFTDSTALVFLLFYCMCLFRLGSFPRTVILFRFQ